MCYSLNRKKSEREDLHMISTEVKIAQLKSKIMKAEQKGNGSAGVVTKWKRQIRNLSK